MSKLESIPMLIKPLQYGNTPSEDAMMRMKIEGEIQNDLNNQYSGGGRFRKHKKMTGYYQHGGITVPQFDGDYSSPQNPNAVSYELNKTFILAKNAGLNDCYATNSCGLTQQKGGYRKPKTNKYMKQSRSRLNKKSKRNIKRSLKKTMKHKKNHHKKY